MIQWNTRILLSCGRIPTFGKRGRQRVQVEWSLEMVLMDGFYSTFVHIHKNYYTNNIGNKLCLLKAGKERCNLNQECLTHMVVVPPQRCFVLTATLTTKLPYIQIFVVFKYFIELIQSITMICWGITLTTNAFGKIHRSIVNYLKLSFNCH